MGLRACAAVQQRKPRRHWIGLAQAHALRASGLHVALVLPQLFNCSSLVAAGVPRKPGMTRDDLFNINAGQWWQATRLRALLLPCRAVR